VINRQKNLRILANTNNLPLGWWTLWDKRVGAMGNAMGTDHWSDLIDQARSGDDQAMDLLLVQLRNYLLFVVNAELNDKLQSKFGGSDVVQQSMLEAYQSIGQFRGASKVELMGWMKKIAIANLRDESRRYGGTKRRDPSREVSLTHTHQNISRPNRDEFSKVTERRETDEQLLIALRKLPDRQREVIEARHKEGQSYRQIASEMQVSENAVRKLWSRGIQNLKSVVGKL